MQIERFGAPEVLEVAEVSSPEPQGDEILIEVEAVGVNRADLLTRSGLYHRAGQPPLVPGFEGSDVVREVGDSVERFATGDRVFAFGGRPASTLSSLRGQAQAGPVVATGSVSANADYDNGAALHD